MKTITLKMVGYVVKGIADVKPWGGGNACIAMDSFKVNSIAKKVLLGNINDGGFGVEKINGAICDIYEDFEGTLKFLKSIEIGIVEDNTRKYYNNI